MEEDDSSLPLVFQMEALGAGGWEEPMKHRPTGEVPSLYLRSAPVAWKAIALMLNITATAMRIGVNGNFPFNYVKGIPLGEC